MDTHTPTPLLYSYYRSSCSARVRAALHYKGIAYDTKPISLLKNEQHEAYKQHNPNGMVPMLVIDGHAISQSAAILEYLEETRPGKRLCIQLITAVNDDEDTAVNVEPPLLPKDPWTRAQPVQNLRLLNRVGDTKTEWARHWITVGFEALEAELVKTAGQYCVGDQITMADVYLPPQVYNAQRFGVDMSRFPTIARIDRNLASVEAFRQAHYSRQPDCPPELRAQD
ncbi:glutathione S-transferase [Syncephalis pseudoplumigaleata]|uniref:Glutathione S-transferase n=1 Tax=Syncephalis pseudoplumigaleata TaxID=1712513 RepID=A0A4P9YV01_9FUNG|nr:glutathione S-transferase [Syncephalis pseudoplumigaleata]|eukprot:RKP23625.1 glutathione S-transferase [Syncephalis pseudoplumigaleata]